MPAFCRHNRFLANCPICTREQAGANPRPSSPTRPRSAPRAPKAAGAPRRPSSTGIRTRKLARDADDGYRSELVPGVKATADAERLARSLAAAAARLEFPGPYEAVATEPDLEEATWLAFLLALTGPDAPDAQAELIRTRPPWSGGQVPRMGSEASLTAAAYRAWAARSGGQAAAFTGEAGWTPVRRFSRLFERLAIPDFRRAARFELLTVLGAAGLYAVEAGSLHLGGEDPTTQAAKRALVSGDVVLLDRRAAALAGAARIPLAALDRGLQTWNARKSRVPELGEDEPAALPGVRAALGL